jgi:hypothetical protein
MYTNFSKLALLIPPVALVHQREEEVFCYAWKHIIYALRVEELPFYVAGPVFRS